MKRILLATLFIGMAPMAFAPTAFAQSDTPPKRTMAPGAGPGAMATSTPAATNPDNCGTPDEFKACPPLPRHPLPYYPAHKHS